MIRRLSIIFALVAAILSSPMLSAQQAVGTWMHYPLYAGTPTKIVATPSIMYYQINGRLYSMNPSTQEFYDYTADLSSPGITLIDYDTKNDNLFVGYESGNIDLLTSDGNIVNLPDIANAVLSVKNGINDVDFWDNTMAVATTFGIVLYDINKGVVRQSGIFNVPVNAVALAGDYIVIASEGNLYSIKKDGLVNRLENFTNLGAVEVKKMRTLNREAGTFILINSKAGYVASLNPEDGTLQYDKTYTNLKNAADIIPAKNSTYVIANNAFNSIDSNGEISSKTIPSAIGSNSYGIWDGLTDVWAGNGDGIGLYDVSTSTVTVKSEKAKPAGATSVDKIVYIKPSADGERIYFTNAGSMTRNPGGSGSAAYQLTDRLINGTFENISSLPAIKNTARVVEDPDDPSRYYLVTRNSGYEAIKNRAVEGAVKAQLPAGFTAPMPNGIDIDKDGNLWIFPMVSTTNGLIAMLPADKRKAGLSQVVASDWQTFPVFEKLSNNFDQHILMCKKSNMIIFASSQPGSGLIAVDTKGTYGNLSDDTYLRWTSFTDQDGKTVSPAYIYSICEDNLGRVWVGNNNGIFELTNPSEATSSSFRCKSLKVPRNDGTSFADYLLESVTVYGLTVDGSNRKWAATDAGIYLISPDGDEIIEHFTVDNSPLQSNTVNAAYADAKSNLVYFGTNQGLLSYASNSAPAAEDYSEVYAYPNPVRPDYTGWITVKGLMNNSLVKITDSAGNVVFSGVSNGGMFTWDGCNTNGRRVKSGVYYVFASQNSGSGPSGAVSKILILN
ncbi:MAG: hypothetical protein HUK14_05105 [Muribaculaceae bacterium]|nr:hypothetical protein [Muribaculaceae bacterium]